MQGQEEEEQQEQLLAIPAHHEEQAQRRLQQGHKEQQQQRQEQAQRQQQQQQQQARTCNNCCNRHCSCMQCSGCNLSYSKAQSSPEQLQGVLQNDACDCDATFSFVMSRVVVATELCMDLIGGLSTQMSCASICVMWEQRIADLGSFCVVIWRWLAGWLAGWRACLHANSHAVALPWLDNVGRMNLT